MSDTFTTDDDDQDQPKMATLPRKVVRKLEREAAEGKEAIEKLAQLEREAAFYRAGVPSDNPAAQYFIKGYEGDTSTEAIRAEWEKAFGSVSREQQDPTVDAELNALQGGQNLVSGQGAPTQDRTAERDAKLQQLSYSDPRFNEKFNDIAREYGTVYGDMVG